MPLGPQTPVLARGFDIMFDPKKSPTTTPGAAQAWAKAYTDYAVSAGIPTARAKEPVLASALVSAFDPNLAGGGPPLFIQALSAFWLGLIIPYMVGTGPSAVSAVVPSGSVSSPQPDNATPLQQADGLAATIAAFTLGSVKVLVPAAPGPPLLLPIL
jgi:hypothetical protein